LAAVTSLKESGVHLVLHKWFLQNLNVVPLCNPRILSVQLSPRCTNNLGWSISYTSDEAWKSTWNSLWSPTPKPAGITQSPTTSTSGVAHTVSIGFHLWELCECYFDKYAHWHLCRL
jgi:hypothetical protein